ncbi:ER membrane complex subunit 2 [Chytriomyces hyalinus]|nr:ER membrane complex subunit 2 [Chytriomyces hyalinus]KAJ3402262.1 ER membrane complex subunit 2 [Chytriomyces hyalinus]
MLDRTSLDYLSKDLSIAMMPGSESAVQGNTEILSVVGPNQVYVDGTRLLASGSFPSDVERLALTEQVIVAALETGRIDEAQALLAPLRTRFETVPKDTVQFGSLRVARLEGMLLEAQGKHEAALDIYNRALVQDEAYAPILKRKVGLLLDQGKTTDAMKELSHYLDHFSSDLEAWTMLATLYLQANMFQQAAFCYEECMMLSTHNYLFTTRYAELMMTMGKPKLALKYFSLAVEITASAGGALRAWYGLRQASKALIEEFNASSAGKGAGKKGKTDVEEDDSVSIDDWKELNRVAGERILGIYSEKKAGSETVSVVKSWLQTV